ncbi:MAG: pyridoxamine 5'-phosphate oxidase family protein [Pyrinomonadaceae bacterium]
MVTHEKHEENVRKLREMIEGIEFAMMTTTEDDGALRSCPMRTQKVEFDSFRLWLS